jgi:3-oxoacyl-[acyl-carrier-protein] synthase-3
MVYIHGIGHFHPENVIDNPFLESLDIGTNDAWILERVGIKTRRTVLSLDYIRETHNRDPRAANEASDFTDAQTTAFAAKVALERAGLQASDIGMVVAGGCSTQWALPAEACRISAELGIDVPSFDLNSGCSTFGAILNNFNSMKPEATPDYILVCNPEASTRVMSYDDRNTAVLFGDCSTAAVVSLKHPALARVVRSSIASDPKGWAKAVVPMGGYFGQDGKAVQGFAIRRTVSTYKELVRDFSDEMKNRLYFIGHQANRLMLEGVCRYTKVDDAHHLFNVDSRGNCASAGAPSALSQNWDKLTDGDDLAMVVVGAGLTWASLHIQFGDRADA